jgi:hypothetical protein
MLFEKTPLLGQALVTKKPLIGANRPTANLFSATEHAEAAVGNRSKLRAKNGTRGYPRQQ